MVRRVLADLDEALEGVSNLKALRRGLVRVAAPEPLSCTLLPELISGYGASHPGVEVRFDDVPIEQVLANLHNGGARHLGSAPRGYWRTKPSKPTPSGPIRYGRRCAATIRSRQTIRSEAGDAARASADQLHTAQSQRRTCMKATCPRAIIRGTSCPVHRVNTALSFCGCGLRLRGFAHRWRDPWSRSLGLAPGPSASPWPRGASRFSPGRGRRCRRPSNVSWISPWTPSKRWDERGFGR